MACNNNLKCNCNFNVKTVGVCDVSRLNINGNNLKNLNWTEISVPEILKVPELKPDIEGIDQVFADIDLCSINLIETPFAYKEYTLFSFYNSLSGLSTTLPGLVTTLTTAVEALITPALDTTLITILNTLSTALTPLSGITGVPALITLVNTAETTTTDLIDDINTALSSVSQSVTNLLTAITTLPFSVELICTALQTLIDSLNALNLLLNSIIGTLTTLVSSLNTTATTIGVPAVTTVVDTATTAINTLITTTLPPLITAATAEVTAILNILAPIDCENSSAFELISNEEGTCLTGRKLIVEGTLNQKIVYTAQVTTQSVHSAHYETPFIAFIIPYANFDGLEYQENIEVYDPTTGFSKLINGYLLNGTDDIVVNLCEEFNIEKCIEDIYVYALDKRSIFKNVTIFLKATPKIQCTNS